MRGLCRVVVYLYPTDLRGARRIEFRLGCPAAGGLATVVYTDVMQAIVLLVGACLVTLLAFAAIDFDWSRVVATTEPGQLDLFLPLSDPNLPWLGILVGARSSASTCRKSPSVRRSVGVPACIFR